MNNREIAMIRRRVGRRWMLVRHLEYIGKIIHRFKEGSAQIERPPSFGAVSPQPAKLAGLFFGFVFIVCEL